MVNMQTNRSPLETEPLTKLLFRYSVPTTLTLMVNYIYNIVDQIFVGQGVGITGMAAINIAFPLSILVNAVSLLLGDGCAANVSLCLGRREQENANKIFGQAVTWIVAAALRWHSFAVYLRRILLRCSEQRIRLMGNRWLICG